MGARLQLEEGESMSMLLTLDDQLRESIDVSLEILDEIETSRPEAQRSEPTTPMSERIAECKASLERAQRLAESIR